MRLLSTLLLLGLLIVAAPAALAGKRVSGPQAKAHISQRLQYSSKVVDKTKPFTVKLFGKKGDKVRLFRASNIRQTVIVGSAPQGALGGARVTVGNLVTGTINMETGEVRTGGVAVPRSAPVPFTQQ